MAGEVLKFGSGDLIELLDESYNANPTSWPAMFDVLAAPSRAGRAGESLALGDMRELGEQAPSCIGPRQAVDEEASTQVSYAGPA